MSTTRTRPEIIDRVLKELVVLGVGQTASAEDVAAVEELIDDTIEELVGQEVIRLDDNDNFPSVIVNPLVRYLAEVAAPGYARPSNQPLMQLAMHQLRVAARGGPTYETMRSEYF
jgi:hypothetical protein